MRFYILSALFLTLSISLLGQYDQKLVKFDFKEINGNPFGVVKLNMTNQRVKVKYFASKDANSNLSVYQRFNEWAFNKKLILVSSGTYYYYPVKTNRDKNTARPVGICIDNGNVINKTTDDNLDALALIYSSGRIAVENLKNKTISVKDANGNPLNLNLNNALDKNIFLKWATDVKATIFQTHLFAYKGNLLVGQNANAFKDYRRFLAAGINNNNETVQYIINLPFNSTILEGSKYALDYLKTNENLKEISFLINLDTGAQNAMETYHPKTGDKLNNSNFSGVKEIKDAINLIVYYYQ
jgi:hypothetical protein